MKLLTNNILITGATHGFGKVIAENFLNEGANVVLCARDESGLIDVGNELTKKYGSDRVFIKKCDVSNEVEVAAFVSFGIKMLGSIDSIVLNAGIYGPMGPTESVSLTEWRKSIDINLFGVLLPCREMIPHFKLTGCGKIIIISGGGATSPMPYISSYAAGKAGALRLMETLAEELREFNISVNAIAPGALNTRLIDQVLAAGVDVVGKEFFDKNKKWKDCGAVPMELGAELAVYLASKESAGITGKLISAQWDNWKDLHTHLADLKNSDIYCLRRIVPIDRNKNWT